MILHINGVLLIIISIGLTSTMEVKCKTNKCIYKCCDSDQHMIFAKTCRSDRKKYDSLDFSNFPLYSKSESPEKTGKSLKDVYEIIPGRFNWNDSFGRLAYDYGRAGHSRYLTEEGILLERVPGSFQEWYQLNNTEFCVDYHLPKKVLKIWSKIQLVRDPTDPSHNQNGTVKPTASTLRNNLVTIGLMVSSTFLALVLLVYCLLPDLRNLGGLILMGYVASLLGSFFLLGILRIANSGKNCLTLTFFVYFFLLASFCWTNVMSLDIWWTFRGYAKSRPIHRRGENVKYAIYSVYAWGLPLVATITLLALNFVDLRGISFVKPNIGLDKYGSCFLKDEAMKYYLHAPLLVLILCNWVLFMMTAFNIWRLYRGSAMVDVAAGTPAAHRTQKQRLFVYLKLSVIMGINWVLEVVSYYHQDSGVSYLSDAFNVLIGLTIFLIFVCRKKILAMLHKRFYSCKTSRSRAPYRSQISNSSNSSAPDSPTRVCNDPNGTKS